MLRTVARDGISFRFPNRWTMDEESAETLWTITLYASKTAWLIVSLRTDAEEPTQVADQTLAAFQSEYQELDSQPALESIASIPAVGHDIDFFSLDTPIACSTRVIATPSGPLLFLAQADEDEWPEFEKQVHALFASVQIEQE